MFTLSKVNIELYLEILLNYGNPLEASIYETLALIALGFIANILALGFKENRPTMRLPKRTHPSKLSKLTCQVNSSTRSFIVHL